MKNQKQRTRPGQQPRNTVQPRTIPEAPADAAGERLQHDQHMARERRAEQITSPDDRRFDPAGQARVGGP
jgi:hypothetical protein